MRNAFPIFFLCLIIGCIAMQGVAAPADSFTGLGIEVGEPKAFDSRTLTLRLEELQTRLVELKALDSAAVKAGLGKASAILLTERAITVAAGQRVPQVVTTETIEGGVRKPTEVVTTQGSKDLQAPSSTTEEGLSPGSLQPELSAADRLAEMMNLEYQIATLQTFLDRSVTDRLHRQDKQGKPKLQGLLGVPISITTPRGREGHVARVELLAEPCGSGTGPKISLVALMPPRKAYNTFAIHKKRNAFGGAAMVGPVYLGASWFGRKEVGYMYQASDTESFQVTTVNGQTLFGWEFRPVLGQQSVAPGTRQMFALLALPRSDDGAEPFELCGTWRTEWVRMDEKKGTVRLQARSESGHSNKWRTLVDTSEGIQTSLQPAIHKVDWAPVGEDRFVAALTGRAFFRGTKVVYGDVVADAPATGLEITSDTTMRLTGKISHLLHGYQAIQGRYGTSTEFFKGEEAEKHPAGFVVGNVTMTVPTPGSGFVEVMVRLVPFVRSDQVKAEPMPGSGYVTAVRDKLLSTSVPATFIDCAAMGEAPVPEGFHKREGRSCVELQYRIDAELVQSSATLTVLYPFRGPRWMFRHSLESFPPKWSLTRVGKGDVCAFQQDPAKCRKERVHERQMALDDIQNRAAGLADADARQHQLALAKHAILQKYSAMAEVRLAELEAAGVRGLAQLNSELLRSRRQWDKDAAADLKKVVSAIFKQPKQIEKALREARPQISTTNLPPEQEHVVFALTGRFVSHCASLFLGSKDLLARGPMTTPGSGPAAVLFTAPDDLVKKFEYLTVARRYQQGATCEEQPRDIIMLKIPPAAGVEKPPAPAFLPGSVLSARKGTAPLLTVLGTNLDRIKLVRFADKVLATIPSEKGDTISVALSREVTANEGPAVLLFETQDGKTLSLNIEVKN